MENGTIIQVVLEGEIQACSRTRALGDATAADGEAESSTSPGIKTII